MVVQRSISKGKYLIAFVLTVLVFSLGLALGTILGYERLSWVEEQNKVQEVDYQSLQFQYLYLSTLESQNESCTALQSALEDSISELGESMDKVVSYKEDSSVNEEDFNLLLRKYTIDNLRYWLFAKRVRSVCHNDFVSVLYFYSSKDCPDCPNQGTVLTYFKRIYGDKLLVFPIDIDLQTDERMVKTLMKQFNITTLPSIVVEEDKFEGVIPAEELGPIICSHFAIVQTECYLR